MRSIVLTAVERLLEELEALRRELSDKDRAIGEVSRSRCSQYGTGYEVWGVQVPLGPDRLDLTDESNVACIVTNVVLTISCTSSFPPCKFPLAPLPNSQYQDPLPPL